MGNSQVKSHGFISVCLAAESNYHNSCQCVTVTVAVDDSNRTISNNDNQARIQDFLTGGG